MRMALLLAGGLLLMATSHYVYVVWVQPWPEYQLTYPSQRHPLDWTSYDARDSGLFGWVHRHGYKVVAHLRTSPSGAGSRPSADRMSASCTTRVEDHGKTHRGDEREPERPLTPHQFEHARARLPPLCDHGVRGVAATLGWPTRQSKRSGGVHSRVDGGGE